MQLIKNRIALNTIALLLILTFAISSVALPAATSQEFLGTKKTYAVVGLMPNPVGVGQEVLVWLGITDQLLTHNDGWAGLTVTVTRPDNTTQTLGPFRTDATGSTGTSYTPTMVGTYYFQTHFPKQNYTWLPGSIMEPTLSGTITYDASDSPIVALTVQETPIEYYPAAPLPTEYWTRPIDLQNREWSSIAGNWLNIPPNRIAPYNDAPESSHILWAKPLSEGGLVGGEYGPHAYEEGDAYEGKFGDWEESAWGAGSSVIINGILYYNRFTTGSFMMPPFVDEMWKQQGIVAVDVRTGKEVWFRNNTRLTFGQILYWDSFNMHGAFAYLWEVTQNFNFMTGGMDNTWTAYDAMTGEFAYKMTDVPSGTRLYGSNGEILIYDINTEQGWIALWNSTRVVNLQNIGGSDDGSWGSLANLQKTFDARTGYQWNKTMPTGLPGAVKTVLKDRIIGSTAEVFANPVGSPPVYIWGISLKSGQEGTLLFNKTWQRPAGDLSVGFGGASSEEGVFTLFSKEDRRHYAFSLDTGEQIWSSKDSQTQLDVFDFKTIIADGKLFSTGYGGIVYAYDIKTGTLLWNYTAEDTYNEILWSNNWPLPAILFVSDGKIYIGHEEHSPVDPKPRGAPFICLNETTGEVIWKIDGAFRQTSWGGRAIIADGIIATLNTYDNRIYAIGKGPTKTSVSALPKASAYGSSIVIEGNVFDVSAGTEDANLTPRFPNGVPAIADENMNEWMKYVYMQFPMPTNAVGVQVTLDVIDANGNYRNVGTATTDSKGWFTFAWKPDIEGAYKLIATFSGSKSYWPSSAETSFVVDPAAASPEEVTIPPDNSATYVMYGTIAIIVAIAIVGAILALLMLRKRP